MSEPGKITASHRSRAAVIYVRQSTVAQVERNTESTARQYDLVARARQLGWPPHQVRVVDGDLGVSRSVTGQRDAFEGMVAEVALGQVGIILALETSDAVKLSSCSGGCRRGGAGEGGGFVVVLAGGQAVLQAAEEPSEQVALGGGVPVAIGHAPVVVGPGAG